jgi:hypothetical protein
LYTDYIPFMYSYLVLNSQQPFNGLSLADLKTHLNVVALDTDAYIASLLQAAVSYCERRLQLDLRPTTWTLVLDQFPLYAQFNWYDRWGNYVYAYPQVAEFAVGRLTQRWQEIYLPRGPVSTVSSITYFTTDNVQTTLDPADTTNGWNFTQATYQVGRVEPKFFWPPAYPRPDAVSIKYSTSFPVVPESVLHAIRLLCGSWFMAREDMAYGPNSVGNYSNEAVECLLSQYVNYQVG